MELSLDHVGTWNGSHVEHFRDELRVLIRLDPGCKGLAVARARLFRLPTRRDEIFAFPVLSSMLKHRIRSEKVKDRRKSKESIRIGTPTHHASPTRSTIPCLLGSRLFLN